MLSVVASHGALVSVKGWVLRLRALQSRPVESRTELATYRSQAQFYNQQAMAGLCATESLVLSHVDSGGCTFIFRAQLVYPVIHVILLSTLDLFNCATSALTEMLA